MTVEKRKANRGPYDYIPRARHFSPSNSLGTFPNPFGKPIFEKEQKSPLSNPFLLNKSSDPFSDTSASRNCNVNPSNVWPPVLSSVPGRETCVQLLRSMNRPRWKRDELRWKTMRCYIFVFFARSGQDGLVGCETSTVLRQTLRARGDTCRSTTRIVLPRLPFACSTISNETGNRYKRSRPVYKYFTRAETRNGRVADLPSDLIPVSEKFNES